MFPRTPSMPTTGALTAAGIAVRRGQRAARHRHRLTPRRSLEDREMSIHDVTAGKHVPHEFNVIIEIPDER